MAVTLKQIAAKAHCSVMTVSNVLNDKGDLYRDEMRRRVLDTAFELGYRPNSSARATRRGRYGNVALLASTHPQQSQLPILLMGAIEGKLASEDLRFSFARLPDEKLTDPEYMLKILGQWSADGLLVNYTHGYPEQMLEIIDHYHVPAIWMNCRLEHDCVFPDDEYAGRIATENLLRSGHRRVAFVDYSASRSELNVAHYSIRDRQAGYEQAMAEAGLTPRVVRGDKSAHADERLAYSFRMLNSEDRPEAIVVYSGAQSIEVAAASLGLSRIPMVVFADVPIRLGNGATDTVIVPQEELGVRAVELLLKKIESPTTAQAPVRIRPKLVRAGSAPAPLKRGELIQA